MRPEIFSLFLLTLIALSRLQSGGDPTPFLAYIVLLIGILWLRRHRERKRKDFIHQLKSCRKELRAGGTVVVDHHLIRYRSVISTYYLNFGGVLCTIRVPSPYRVTDAGDEHHDSFICSLGSLLAGWWAIPGGPITTITTILQNFAGGERMTVAELIDLPLLKQAAARRNAIEAHLLENEAAALKIDAPVAPGDFGPESKANRALLRGSNTYRDVAETVGWNRRQYLCEIDDVPPGTVWIEAIKARIRSAVEEIKEQSTHQRSTRQKHAALVDRRALHDSLRS